MLLDIETLEAKSVHLHQVARSLAPYLSLSLSLSLSIIIINILERGLVLAFPSGRWCLCTFRHTLQY